jgi:hypothetical protein
MFHLNERTLEKLVAGSAEMSEVYRIQRHVAECRACASRLEEWRDHYAEVDQAYPELALDQEPAATVTPTGMVVVPGEEKPRRFMLSFASTLWILALLMALVVGYGAHRLRRANAGLETATSVRPKRLRPETGNGAGATLPPVVSRETTLASPPKSPPSAPVSAPISAPAPAPKPTPAPVQRTTPPRVEQARTETPQPKPRPERAPERAAPERAAPNRAAPNRAQPTPSTAVSPNFRSTPVAEATRRLGGRLRLLNGFQLDHLEIGPASAVPGAQSGLAVVRVVYRTADGGRMLLDQQLIPADSSGFRPIDDPTLETGQTAYGTAPNGVSVATWLDEDGYRISLVARAPVDSLKKLVPLVQ